MVNQYVTLDGKTCGIIVKTIGDCKRKYIYSKGNSIRLFRNIDIAEVTAKSIVGNNIKFEYYFSINGNIYSINDCQRMEDHWEFIDNGVRLIINERKTNQITRLGYIVFENGDTKRCEKAYGIKRVSELMEYIKDIATSILTVNGEYSISKITRVSNNQEYCLHVKNSTAKIHILTNSRLMDTNQSRKENKFRCLPFIKDMDKFTTLYFYCSKDLAETPRMGSDKLVDKIIDIINEYLTDNYSDYNPKIVPVGFSGYINIEEGEYIW